MSLILGKCCDNFRAAAHLYPTDTLRRHPNDTIIWNCILRLRQDRIRRIRIRQGSNEITEFIVLDAVAMEPKYPE